MSEKKADKGKLFQKLHKLQKRLFRSLSNPGHHDPKEDKMIEVREKKLIEKIKSKK